MASITSILRYIPEQVRDVDARHRLRLPAGKGRFYALPLNNSCSIKMRDLFFERY